VLISGFEKRAETVGTYSEWKLDYSDGFIRRGATGLIVAPVTLIFKSEKQSILVINFIIQGLILLSFIRILPLRLGLLDICILLSPLLFLNFWRANIWEGQFRKENLFLLFWVNSNVIIKLLAPGIKYLGVAIIMAILSLFHELHFFLVPIAFFAVIKTIHILPGKVESRLILGILLFLFFLLFIYDSHPNLVSQLNSEKFSSIGDKHYAWAYAQRQSELRTLYAKVVFSENFTIYYLFFNLITVLTILLIRSINPSGFERIRQLLPITLLCIVPLFIIGWDWGRWTSLIFNILGIYYYLDRSTSGKKFEFKLLPAFVFYLWICLTTSMKPFRAANLRYDALAYDTYACADYFRDKWPEVIASIKREWDRMK
jgi:hypothetical protein